MSKIISDKGELIVKSQVCLTPSQCYSVETLIPWYVTLVLIGSVYLIGKEIVNSVK